MLNTFPTQSLPAELWPTSRPPASAAIFSSRGVAEQPDQCCQMGLVKSSLSIQKKFMFWKNKFMHQKIFKQLKLLTIIIDFSEFYFKLLLLK